MARSYLDDTGSHFQLFRQQSHQFLVGGAINWWRGQAHAQRAVVFPGNLAARRPRHYPDLKSNGAVFFAVAQHSFSPLLICYFRMERAGACPLPDCKYSMRLISPKQYRKLSNDYLYAQTAQLAVGKGACPRSFLRRVCYSLHSSLTYQHLGYRILQ